MELTSYFIETWGCQMNVLDGQRLAGELTALGMRGSRLPTTADVVLLNTCSVRERAVDKVRSRIGALQIQRQETGKPVLIGVCGCVGEQAGEALLGRFRGLDFVLGTGRV
ncbi:MAG: tRNA (N6-isopentenyl adenosine(37)-C2)-methylthiotransferase MiaB, partial [Acidobacteria bacterium]|nr:tRNA (N6-isopentenyl adenosine(37)-C2)-methylthiotransferase MiaB [Acidobacteriota bacterium]